MNLFGRLTKSFVFVPKVDLMEEGSGRRMSQILCSDGDESPTRLVTVTHSEGPSKFFTRSSELSVLCERISSALSEAENFDRFERVPTPGDLVAAKRGEGADAQWFRARVILKYVFYSLLFNSHKICNK